ncbi:uncharacterized protein BO88DRAFT_83431 [Aspergillus vadensis CBS 113365]|uniref:Uncharacterized protein n=1 Tax=Aspergillus vadensis (strain CBS 113365 / IMI 142717 / IBT 24658) TaxID=1448311 RepID=A0A319B3Z9_ASPVC|nr:hypothetical protein BO88DRAFT_83431 [Aspergillus vadensis CBS 113365]PYH67075.1 hypothetical protein BO88DRAFT_83431 [Aspergillus vadensis CBS 113365]
MKVCWGFLSSSPTAEGFLLAIQGYKPCSGFFSCLILTYFPASRRRHSLVCDYAICGLRNTALARK